MKKQELKRAMKEYLTELGRKGGKARLTTMTQKQRSASAAKASAARWKKMRVAK